MPDCRRRAFLPSIVFPRSADTMPAGLRCAISLRGRGSGCPRSISLLRFFAVHHPGDAELIDAHAEAWGPESLFERHRHSSVLSQSFEDPLTLGELLQMDRHIRSLGLLITPRRSVGAHQYVVAHIECCVH